MSPGPDFHAHAARYAEPDEAEDLAASVRARLAWRLRRGHKACRACGLDRPPGAFRSDSSRRDGLYPTCRACEVSRRAEARADL